jgi:hypothetical protein
MTHTERWNLFRSGQFVHHRSFNLIPGLADRVRVVEILDVATAAFEFAARMARRGVLSPEAVITLELTGVDGLALTWPQGPLGEVDAVEGKCWCQDESITVSRRIGIADLEARRRELALGVALGNLLEVRVVGPAERASRRRATAKVWYG